MAASFQFIEEIQSLTPPLGPGLSLAHRIRKDTRWPKQARLSPNPSTKPGQLQAPMSAYLRSHFRSLASIRRAER